MRKTVFALLCLVLLYATPAGAAETKVAVMNTQAILMQSDAVKDANTKIAALEKDAKTKLDKLRDTALAELKKLDQDKSKATENGPKMDKIREKFGKDEAALMNKLNQERQNLNTTIFGMLRKVSQNYATTKGLDLIVDSTAAPYFASGLDVTKDVLDALNKEFAANGGKVAAPKGKKKR